jgi:transposase
MSKCTTIGLDLAKTVFQVHGIDDAGNVVVRRRLRRGQVLAFFAGLPRCLVGIEACATAHHWARELIALGHDVRLMPPQYVKAYVRRHKNDAADAEAICEAVQRPSMRFVPVKSTEQQSALMMHRARDLLIRQRTMLVNALRGHLAEFGIVGAQGVHKLAGLIRIVMDDTDRRVPDLARQVLQVIARQIEDLQMRIVALEAQLLAWHRSNPGSQRLATIPGIGPIIATAIAATVPDPTVFRSGREFAAWLGLVPRQSSTGGKARLGIQLGVARNILSDRLSKLVSAGILVKRPFRPGARRMEYRLTAKGEALRPSVERIEAWGRNAAGHGASGGMAQSYRQDLATRR